jgi:ABC-type antimicrobial peptide transport system permease subunit
MSSGLIGLSSSPAWVHEHAGDSLEVYQLFVDAGFIPNFKLEFLAGGNFPNETWQRERFIIVNEEFIKAYKIDRPADALGRTFRVDGMELEVIGVLKNFHYAPLLVPIGKFFFRMDPAYFTYANLLVSTGDVYTTFSQFERTWQQLSTAPMAADFFENELKEGYSMYRGLLKIVGFLGLLAITISVLGMLGMVVYTTESRTKEVGVRKVMGASVGGLAYLLSKDYLKLMVWAILFSVPVMVVLFDQFLPRMQYYSVKLSPLDVVASTILLFGLGIGAIASQTFKTAQINPAETLKDQ